VSTPAGRLRVARPVTTWSTSQRQDRTPQQYSATRAIVESPHVRSSRARERTERMASGKGPLTDRRPPAAVAWPGCAVGGCCWRVSYRTARSVPRALLFVRCGRIKRGLVFGAVAWALKRGCRTKLAGGVGVIIAGLLSALGVVLALRLTNGQVREARGRTTHLSAAGLRGRTPAMQRIRAPAPTDVDGRSCVRAEPSRAPGLRILQARSPEHLAAAAGCFEGPAR
jgi:hypothetical protein